MDLGHGSTEQGATIEGKGRFSRDRTVKIRMSNAELSELDEICKKLGFAERATTIRTLMQMFRELEQARRIVQAYCIKIEAETKFESLMKQQKTV